VTIPNPAKPEPKRWMKQAGDWGKEWA
jgi:hypothetical protein